MYTQYVIISIDALSILSLDEDNLGTLPNKSPRWKIPGKAWRCETSTTIKIKAIYNNLTVTQIAYKSLVYWFDYDAMRSILYIIIYTT